MHRSFAAAGARLCTAGAGTQCPLGEDGGVFWGLTHLTLIGLTSS